MSREVIIFIFCNVYLLLYFVMSIARKYLCYSINKYLSGLHFFGVELTFKTSMNLFGHWLADRCECLNPSPLNFNLFRRGVEEIKF